MPKRAQWRQIIVTRVNLEGNNTAIIILGSLNCLKVGIFMIYQMVVNSGSYLTTLIWYQEMHLSFSGAWRWVSIIMFRISNDFTALSYRDLMLLCENIAFVSKVSYSKLLILSSLASNPGHNVLLFTPTKYLFKGTPPVDITCVRLCFWRRRTR